MNTEPKDDPGKKLRKLLGSSSPLTRLPKKNAKTTTFLPDPEEDEKAEEPSQEDDSAPAAPSLKISSASSPKPKADPASKGRLVIFGPALWNIASVLSLAVNVILIIVLIVLVISINSIGLSVSSLLNMGTDLLGGLYGNFEKMDRAHITTDIKVETTIPVKFDLLLNQQTNVVLSQDVTINNALVTVNTGGLNISRANTTIVLPSGTNLPVVLNLTVPVDTTVPVVLNVPVDIPLQNTQLHEPFTGLQEVVRPFYCMINANAVNLDGAPICK